MELTAKKVNSGAKHSRIDSFCSKEYKAGNYTLQFNVVAQFYSRG